jgi:hypothetical protein
MKITSYPYQEQLNKIHGWIKSADQKTSISFAVINGVSLAFIIPTSKIIIDHTAYLGNYVFVTSLVGTLVLLSISEFCTLMALFPRITSKLSSKSILYFGSISNMTPEELSAQIKNTTPATLVDDYVNQIIISSQICVAKHSHLKNSVQSFIISLIFMFTFLITTISLLV